MVMQRANPVFPGRAPFVVIPGTGPGMTVEGATAAAPPAVIIHGIADARTVLALGQPVTLLSAPGAGVYAGAGWWKALTDQARRECPDAVFDDVLDCADSAGAAMAALRVGVNTLILWNSVAAWPAVAEIAAGMSGAVLPVPPAALDMADRGAIRRLEAWLHVRSAPGDIAAPLG